MKSFIAVLFVFISAAASADPKTPSTYLAEAWIRTIYAPFLASLENVEAIPTRNRGACDRFYAPVKSSGQMKLVMGIGYYDFSEGESFRFNYRADGETQIRHYDFGMNATIDMTYETMYRMILTTPCKGQLQLCGFSEGPAGVYSKSVLSPEGHPIHAIVEIRNPSVTAEHAQNVGPLRVQQESRSKAVTDWFFGSIPSADFVVYNGHSRKGGGPDFSPPRLLPNRHVDYRWYQKNHPGLDHLLAALAGGKHPSGFLMMSCNSTKLFESAVAKAAPEMSYASTNDVIPGDIPNKGVIAGLDSYLRFQCEEGFDREMRGDSRLRAEIHPLVFRK